MFVPEGVVRGLKLTVERPLVWGQAILDSNTHDGRRNHCEKKKQHHEHVHTPQLLHDGNNNHEEYIYTLHILCTHEGGGGGGIAICDLLVTLYVDCVQPSFQVKIFFTNGQKVIYPVAVSYWRGVPPQPLEVR